MFRISLLGTVSLFLIGGCCKNLDFIEEFEVVPSHVCHGGKVKISWQSREGVDDNRLFAEPHVPEIAFPAANVNWHGEMEATVEESTNFKLRSTLPNCDYDVANRSVTVLTGDQELSLGASGRCNNGVPEWGTLYVGTEWPENLKVTKVKNDMGFSITVCHDSECETVWPGEESDAFHGQPLLGQWTLRPDPSLFREYCPLSTPGIGGGGSTVPDPEHTGDEETGRPLPRLHVTVIAKCNY